MTAEEPKGDGQTAVPMEGEDISMKKDGGVLKVCFYVCFVCLLKRLYLLHVAANGVSPGYVVGRG